MKDQHVIPFFHFLRRSGWLWVTLLFGLLLAEARIWTDVSGKQVEAELLRVDGVSVTLKKPDGASASIPLDRLSQADREWAQNWARSNQGASSLPEVNPEASNLKQPGAKPGEGGPLFHRLPVSMQNNIPFFTIAGIGIIIAFFSALMFYIQAFGTSIWWGLGCLFVPFVSLVFLIMYWDRAKSPFLWHILGVIILLFGLTLFPPAMEL